MDLVELQRKISSFNTVRGWDAQHNSRDLVLCLTEEVGELAKLVAWPEAQEEVCKDNEVLAEELADVLIYLVCLANHRNIDLENSVLAKIEINEMRFRRTEQT